MKKEQGITLVSLVVTIIVLIILAGVSINLLLGQNGIITIAKQSKENMQLAQVEEQEELNELYSQISEEGSNSISYDSIAKLVEFKREIASAITDVGINTPEDASAETMASNIRSFASSLNANSISYDNTNSKLTATNVQSAVDELDTEVDAINSSLEGKADGTFTVLTGTTHAVAGQQTSQNYPDGLNQNNCIVSGVMIKLGANWYSGNYNSGYTYINAQVILGSSQVSIAPASGWTNCPFKIILYRYV